MGKSKILKEIANNEISLEVALSRLLIIASDLENGEIINWVENELNGYKYSEDIPSYRKINANYLRYSGINGSFQVKNQPLPLTWLNRETTQKISPVFVFDSIATIQKYASGPDNLEIGRDLTFLASEVEDNTGIQCLRISQMMSVSYYREISSQVRSKLLKIFIEIDKVYGNIDNLDINETNSKEKATIITDRIVNIIDNSIHIGDNNKIEKSEVATREASYGKE